MIWILLKKPKPLCIVHMKNVVYYLCDLEIATQTIGDEKSGESKMLVEYLFCAGNLSTTAFKNFEQEYVCNRYCIKLKLTQL